jgi:hypothetical protein
VSFRFVNRRDLWEVVNRHKPRAKFTANTETMP